MRDKQTGCLLYMKKIISLTMIFSFLLLSGCFLRVHKLDVEQGNIITQENLSKLNTGMSETQVKDIIGNPLLINIFTPERIDYVYTMQKGYQTMVVKRITLIFQNGRLTEIKS